MREDANYEEEREREGFGRHVFLLCITNEREDEESLLKFLYLILEMKTEREQAHILLKLSDSTELLNRILLLSVYDNWIIIESDDEHSTSLCFRSK